MEDRGGHQLLGDLLVRLARGEQAQHLQLTLAQRLDQAGKVPIVGDGGSMFSFLHAYDAATALLAAVDPPPPAGSSTSSTTTPPWPGTGCRRWRPSAAPRPRAHPGLAGPAVRRRVGRGLQTSLAGASNLRARQRLDWQPTYSTWRDGLAAERISVRRVPG